MDRNESILKNFIIEKIERTGGSCQIKYLCQLLISLSYDVRSSVANNQGELMRFLRKHSEIFQVDANGNVRLQSTNSSVADEEPSRNRFEKSEPDDDLPKKLNNGEGIVIKIHPTFGFIAAKSPFKTTIYFTPKSFGNDQVTLLTEIDNLHVGAKIGFHANKGSNERSSKYRAFKVWLIKSGKEENKSKLQNDCEPKTRKTCETGKFDGVVNEGEGKILKLFQNFGFIIIDDDKNNTVFFYKSQLVKYENIVDLNKVLKVGDLVEFKAVRTGQKNIQARWSATQVWVKKSAKSKPNSKESTDFKGGGLKKQYLKNQNGKIYPHSKGIVIKFGPRFEQIADADSSVFYMLGTKVSDVSWEFSDGDNVRFDAVEIKSHPGWKATLVWTGERPNVVLPPDLGDFSEFVDDIDDAASTISKLSDNSILSENSSQSYQPPLSRSSGYSSMRLSQEDLHFRIPPSRNSYNERRHESLGRNSNSNSIETRSYVDMDVEDISDATSCYSRSSDKSSSGPNRGRSRAQRRRSANFKKKFSNQDIRQNNVNSSNSWRQENSVSNSYSERRQESVNRNFDSYERRQKSLNRNSNSYNETRQKSPDRNSNSYHEKSQENFNWNSKRKQENGNKGSKPYRERQQGSVNQSSNSYQDAKTRSSSVGKRSFKNDDRYKNDERFKRHEEILNKYIEDSPDEDADDNNSTISESSKNSLFKKIPEPETKSYINWADTPYPGEDDDLVVDYKISKVDSSNVKAVTQDSTKESVYDAPNLNQDDVYNSDDEFSDAVQDRVESLPLDDIMDPNELLTTINDSITDAKEEVPSKCSVKIFKEIEGTIKRVHCKYGQVTSPLLPMAASFFWQDVYYKEVPVPVKHNDLKQVLKVGDVLKFNCISVVDDEEHNFIKCTMLWKGKKPNKLEMTPQEYIASEHLNVSLKEDNYEIEVVSPNNETPSSVIPDQPKRKFLVTVNSEGKEDSDSDIEVSASGAKPLAKSFVPNEDLDSDISSEEGAASGAKTLTNSFVPNEDLDSDISSKEGAASGAKPLANSFVPNEDLDSDISSEEGVASGAKPLANSSVPIDDLDSDISSDESETEKQSDKDKLIEGISNIIKYGGLPVNSQIDLSSISSEILNFVMNVCAAKKLQTVSQTAKETQTDVDHDSLLEPVLSRNNRIELTNTESQTIFTGNVSGNNIFTQ